MWEQELKDAINAGLEAKKEIMKIYHEKFDVEIKSDNSPVTKADKTADTLIRNYLKERYPNYAFLTEESEDDLSRLDNDYVWIVDPVDGTKDFVAKDDEFTTNIALSYKHKVVLGVVIIPALDEIYYATENNGAFFIDSKGTTHKICCNNKVNDLTVLTSVFHTTQEELNLIEKHKNKISKVIKKGSSLKACYIAAGLAELSYRLSPNTKEWDTAASQIIVEEAGGLFVKPNGDSIFYNRKDVYNREGYLIVNKKENILL